MTWNYCRGKTIQQTTLALMISQFATAAKEH